MSDLAVSDPDAATRARLAEAHPGLTVVDAPVDADAALLAVKPDVAEPVCLTLGAVGIDRVLSVVAGMASARLEAVLPPGAVVVRAMPNTPALIGAGVAGMSGGARPPPPTWTGRRASSRPSARWCASPSATSTR